MSDYDPVNMAEVHLLTLASTGEVESAVQSLRGRCPNPDISSLTTFFPSQMVAKNETICLDCERARKAIEERLGLWSRVREHLHGLPLTDMGLIWQNHR